MPQETIREWMRRHSADGGPVKIGPRTYLFPDGAVFEEGWTGMAGAGEPLDNKKYVLQQAVLYRKRRVAISTTAFPKFKDAVLGRTEGFGSSVKWESDLWGPQPGGDKATLKKLARIVAEDKRKLKEARAAAKRLPEILTARERAEAEANLVERQMAERARSRAAADAEIAGIEI